MTDTPGLSVPLEVKLRQFERSIARLDAMVVKSANSIKRRYEEANGRAARSFTKSAEASAQVFERAIEKEARSFQHLKASVDPAYAAQMRYETAVRRVAAAVRMGAVSQKDANMVLAQAKVAYLGAATASTTAASGLGRFVNVSGRGRFVLQNMAYQVGDFAVQVGAGTSALRAASMQVPQLLGALGTLGGTWAVLGPLLAVVAAIGLPVAAFLLATGDNAEESAAKVETFAEALSSTQAAIERAGRAMRLAGAGGAEDMAKIYGAVTEKVRDLASALSEIETRAAKVQLDVTLDKAFGQDFLKQVDQAFGVVGGALMTAGTERAKEDAAQIRKMMSDLQAEMNVIGSHGAIVPAAMTQQMADFREELAAVEGRVQDIGNLTSQLTVSPDFITTWEDLLGRLDDARNADKFAVVASVLSDMRGMLDGVGNKIDQGVKDKLAQAESQARMMAKNILDAKKAGQEFGNIDMAGGVRSATSAAVELARQMGISLDIAKRLAGSVGPSGFVLDPRDPRFDPKNVRVARVAAQVDAMANDFGTVSPFDPSRQAGTDKKRRGGSGEPVNLFANSERQITALERQIAMVGKSRREVVALTAKYALLDAAREKGVELDQRSSETGRTLREEIDLQAESVANLTVEAEQYAAKAAFMATQNQSLKDGFIDAIVEGKNFGDVLDGVAKQMAKAALQAALFGDGPMAGLFGGGGFLGGILGGGGGLRFFAQGTDYAPGGPAIVGEKGPELVHLPRGSKVIPNHKLGQGGGRSQVDVFVHPSGEFDTRVQQISGDVAVNVSGQMISANNRQVSQMQRR